MGWLVAFARRATGEKTVELADDVSCRSEPSKAKFNRSTMHVEVRSETPRDGGSIPPASILRR